MDIIHIQNLRLRCMIGFSAHELHDKQDVLISLRLFTDIRQGGASDDPALLSVNYRTVNKAVIAHVEASHCKTLEALATQVAQVALQHSEAERVQVELSKPGALRFTDNVSIIIERSRSDFGENL